MRLTSQVHSCSNNAATARRVATGKSNNEVKAGILNPASCTGKNTFPATLKTHPRSHQHIYRSVMISAKKHQVYPYISVHTGGCLVAFIARVNHWVKASASAALLAATFTECFLLSPREVTTLMVKKNAPSPWFGMVDVVGRSANIEVPKQWETLQRQYPLVICYIAIENGH